VRFDIFVVLLFAFVSLFGCDRSEQKAEALLERAMQHAAADELIEAIALFDEIEQRYFGTAAAGRAHDERLLYSGLVVAVETYPQRAARDLMIQTARALDRARRGRAWPNSLDRLLPELLAEPPIDPWGRPLIYLRKPRGAGYRLNCLGSDGRAGGTGDAADLLVEDGDWVRAPAVS